MNPYGIPAPATPDLRAIITWTIANGRAKADYYAHPISSCHVSGCDRLAADAYTCVWHRRTLEDARRRMQSVRSA